LGSTRHHTFAGQKSKPELKARSYELNRKALTRVAATASLWEKQFAELLTL
jgi:hypothetical protein